MIKLKCKRWLTSGNDQLQCKRGPTSGNDQLPSKKGAHLWKWSMYISKGDPLIKWSTYSVKALEVIIYKNSLKYGRLLNPFTIKSKGGPTSDNNFSGSHVTILLLDSLEYTYHGCYKLIVMPEKCGLPDINVIHIEWIIGHNGNWKKSKSWGPFWSY